MARGFTADGRFSLHLATDLMIVTVSGDVETNATISGRIVGLKIIG